MNGDELKSLLNNNWQTIIPNIDEVPWDKLALEINDCEDELCPKIDDIFNAFNNCEPKNVKVVLIGQDPYHTPNTAHGYSFSVDERCRKIPPSLKNIHKELMQEYNLTTEPKNGSLLNWVNEGVLLMNSVLTVRQGCPNSHSNIGWEILTTKIIKAIDEHCKCVFLLLGSSAQNLCKNIVKNNIMINCGHPSPLNTSKSQFIGSDCFRKTNESLMKLNRLPVRWTNIF